MVRREVNAMSEKEWMKDFIYERMKLHWQELYRSKADDRREEGRTLDQFEAILKRLTKKREKPSTGSSIAQNAM